jgi:hypothetical protein
MSKTENHLYSETAVMQNVYTKKIEPLSPSVKLVFKVLEYREFDAERSGGRKLFSLARYPALCRLKKKGYLRKGSAKDARQSLYG